MNTGLLVAITAMLTAFAVLSGIALVVYLLRLFAIPWRGHPAPGVPVTPEPPAPAVAGSAGQVLPEPPGERDTGIPPQVVAAITAALSTYLDRPVAFTPHVTPAAAGNWVAVGRQVQFGSRRMGTR